MWPPEDIVDRVQNTNIEHVMFEPTAKRVRAIVEVQRPQTQWS